MVRCGSVWLGLAWPGLAWPGFAWLGVRFRYLNHAQLIYFTNFQDSSNILYFLTSEKVSGVVPSFWSCPFLLGFGSSFSGFGPSCSGFGPSFSGVWRFSRLPLPCRVFLFLRGWAFLRLDLSYRGLAFPSAGLPFLVSVLALPAADWPSLGRCPFLLSRGLALPSRGLALP